MPLSVRSGGTGETAGYWQKNRRTLDVEMKDRFKGLHGDLFTPAAAWYSRLLPARRPTMLNKKRLRAGGAGL